jgi:DNA-binding response OmpR family regulator
MRILVADDDPIYRGVLEDVLREWRFDVVLAEDGAEALAILAGDDPPQLILLDWDMPHVDGFEVATTIRSINSDDETYILMITANQRKPDLMRVLVCGADDYLLKPFDPLDLKIHIRSAMRIFKLREEVKALKNHELTANVEYGFGRTDL